MPKHPACTPRFRSAILTYAITLIIGAIREMCRWGVPRPTLARAAVGNIGTTDSTICSRVHAGSVCRDDQVPFQDCGIDVKSYPLYGGGVRYHGGKEVRWEGMNGGRCKVRTCDPCRVKAVLYR